MAVATVGLFLIFVSIILTLFLLSLRDRRRFKFLSAFPSPPKVMFIGSSAELLAPNPELTQTVYFQWPKLYGPRYGMEFVGRTHFTSMDHSDIEKLLSSTVHTTKGHEYDFLKNWLGEGLLTSSGSKWFKRRKLLTPAFHFKILDQFMPIFNDQANTFVEILGIDSNGGEKPLEITQYVSRFTLDVICETAMGKRIDAQKVKDSAYVAAVLRTNTLLIYRAMRPWYFLQFIWYLSPSGRAQKQYLKIIHEFTNSVIQERKAEMKREGWSSGNEIESDDVFMGSRKRPVAFLDLLIQHQAENPNELSDEDIREETDTFMFEGHDTTAASLSWTIHLIGSYPEVQKRVHAELGAIFGEDRKRPITTQDLTQMKYLESCIKEALRMYPSVPFIGRCLRDDLKLDDKTVVPKGIDFSVFVLSLHHDPVVFPQPFEYKPERFLPENSIGRHPYAFIPFSAGPRNCIGQKFALMEEKIVLANLFRNFEVKSLDKREDVVLTTEVITRPKDGFRIQLQPR